MIADETEPSSVLEEIELPIKQTKKKRAATSIATPKTKKAQTKKDQTKKDQTKKAQTKKDQPKKDQSPIEP